MSKSNRIDEISQLILELASGNFAASGRLSDNNDEFDAIIAGINMLGEELRSSTVSRDYLQSIYHGVVDMLVIMDSENLIAEVNKSLCSSLHYQPAELIGKPFSILLANKKDKLLPVKNELLRKGHSYDFEKNFIAKTGLIIPVSCSVSHIYGNDGEIQGTLYIAKDISKLKKTEEDLKNKNLEMDTFIYKAAHDLKGPVASIVGITNVAPLDIQDPVALKYFAMIQECSAKLDKVLINLREIAAIDKAKKERARIDIRSIVKTILTNHAAAIQEEQIELCVNIEVHKDFYSNEKLFFIIVNNLIDNGIKFKRPQIKTQIELNIQQVNDGIEILVKDNGLGIKKKLQPKVFDMFFRGHNSRDGSGLGLYMTKIFVNALGGAIQLKSIENKGTSFHIHLPEMK